MHTLSLFQIFFLFTLFLADSFLVISNCFHSSLPNTLRLLINFKYLSPLKSWQSTESDSETGHGHGIDEVRIFVFCFVARFDSTTAVTES